MKFLLALFLFNLSTTIANAVDIGDGSDGTCAVIGPATTLIALPKTTYQCTSVVIDDNLFFNGATIGAGGSAAITIKSQTTITINAGKTINLNGSNGANGNLGGVAAGGFGGAGGSAGGTSAAANGADGAGLGKGLGGDLAPLAGPTDDVGGGGGGGSYQSVGAVALTGDSFGTPVAAGANGGTYGPENNFENLFLGGSGGGAGGSGFEVSTARWFGSGGGGGGGAIHLVAGGIILIDGNITSNGGNGGGSGAEIASGGGGGASGGAIWIQSSADLIVNGLVTASPGAGGVNANAGILGDGGAGGDGRIRLDDSNGVITGAGVGGITPTAVTSIFVPTAITSGSTAISRQYSSGVSCAKVALPNENPMNHLINMMLGIMLSTCIYFSFSRKGKI